MSSSTPPRNRADVRPEELRHQGLHARRLDRTPAHDDTRREQALAKAWEGANTESGAIEPIAKVLVPGCNQAQASAMATVIQWLGSDVGFAFLQSALADAGYEVRPRADRRAPLFAAATKPRRPVFLP